MNKIKYRFQGEWAGEWKTKSEALEELVALNRHPVFGNQFWWLEKMEKDGSAHKA